VSTRHRYVVVRPGLLGHLRIAGVILYETVRHPRTTSLIHVTWSPGSETKTIRLEGIRR
jgi:hypothetical protein